MATLHKKHFCSSNITISAVFFDLDNTLIETRKGDNQTCRKILYCSKKISYAIDIIDKLKIDSKLKNTKKNC
ncbi:neurochondrin [Apis cerana cerana]|uniref:Neurochondrin n=1 Tax=Apis cerana cerana TaxID=94128 RepID=A0A2A3E4F2_APICC|nr:neurochondrin [Apis cerana cerana]